MKPLLIVHGGAKEILPEEQQPHRDGCLEATRVGWEVLQRGGSAIEAVEAAIRCMEDNEIFNAGRGSDLNADGDVQMDAALIEGSHLNAGAVGFIQGVRHPISVARKVMESNEVFISGDGAKRFAQQVRGELCRDDELVTEKKREEWLKGKKGANNTVGCVAIDAQGLLAAGASTGGTGGNKRGRIGDTPQMGCGTFADNTKGACAMTGDGENIARVVLSKTTIDMIAPRCPPEAAARAALEILEERTKGEGGLIIVDRDGNIGWNHNSKHMAVAYQKPEMSEPKVFLQKAEERNA